MSFGNKGSNSRPSRGASGMTGANRPAKKANDSGISASFLALSIGLIALTFFGSLGTLYFIRNANSTSTAVNPALAALFENEPVPQARDYDTSGGLPFMMPSKWHMKIKVNKTKTGLDPIDSELHEHCTKRISKTAARWSVIEGNAFVRPEKGAKFLSCLMQHQVSRICKSVYRKRLAARIDEYLRAYKVRAKLLKGLQTNKMAQQFIAVDRIGKSDKNGGIETGRVSAQIIPNDLGSQLKKLSAVGLIGKSDFSGLFSAVPVELDPYLQDLPKPC